MGLQPTDLIRGESRDPSCSRSGLFLAVPQSWEHAPGSCDGNIYPGEGVVSREFSDEFGGCLVVEASQSGAVVIGEEGEEVGIALGMVEEAAVVGGAVLRHRVETLAAAAVEALDHAPRLREGRLLVCGRKGWVRRWVMARAAPVWSKGCWSKGCWPEGRP